MVGTRFSAFRSRRSLRLPPAILRGQIDGTPLMRFRVSLQRFPAAPFRPRVTNPRTIPLRRSHNLRHPRRQLSRPCGFLRLASPLAFIVFIWRRRPRGSFVAGFFSAADVPGPHQAVIAAWPELLIPATLMGFIHTLRSIAPLAR